MSTQNQLLTFCREFIFDYSLPKRIQIHKENLESFSAKKEKPVWEQTIEYSMDLFPVLEWDNIRALLGRKWKTRISNCRYLTYWINKVIKSNQHNIPEIPISSCLPCFLERRNGSPKNVHNDIVTLEMCGVLVRVPYKYVQKGCNGSDDYHWGSNGYVEYYGNAGGQSFRIRDTKDKMCYRYIISRNQLKMIIGEQKKLFGSYHWTDIFDKVDEAKKDISVAEYTTFEKRYGNRIRLDCGLRISIDCFESKKQLEQLILLYLLKHNNSLSDFISKREHLNRNLTAESKGHYTVKFHYSKSGKMLTGLSIRDWNDFCLFKSNTKKELSKDENNNYYFNEILKDTYTGKRFYDELYKKRGWKKQDVFCYDVKSSVPRTLYFKTYGRWLPQNVDLYELIYGVKFNNKVERDLFKSITLPALFTKSLDKFIHSVKLHYTKDEIRVMNLNKEYGGTFNYEDFATYIWTCVHRMFPNIEGTTVFQQESEIMMLVEECLQNCGIEYEHKFDAFYTNVEILNFDQLLTRCANLYKELYWTNNVYLPEPVTTVQKDFGHVSTIDNMII